MLTLSSFIPTQQEEKLPLIDNAAAKLAGAFDPKNAAPPPSDTENIDALKEAADRLIEATGDQNRYAALPPPNGSPRR